MNVPRRRPPVIVAPPEEPRPEDDLPSREDLQRLIETMERGIEAFQPAADAIVTLVGKFDALCRWFRSKKTIATAIVVALLVKYAPADLAEALTPLIQALFPT